MIIRPIVVVREAKVSDLKFSYVMTAINSFLDFMGVADVISVTESSMVVETGSKAEDFLRRSRIPGKTRGLIAVCQNTAAWPAGCVGSAAKSQT